MVDYGELVAKAGLEIKAIKLSPDKPFVWASGFQMPIYNDNRMFLFYPQHRQLITQGFRQILIQNGLEYDVLAGTSTAGISPATSLAESEKRPMIYVRDKPKDHGLKNQIEGIDAERDLEGRKVILIEDLISTGGSSVRAVEAIRAANGKIDTCLSIFHYGLDKAIQLFHEAHCNVFPLLEYRGLLKVAKETGYVNSQQADMLAEWRTDPFKWGEKHGFPKVEREK